MNRRTHKLSNDKSAPRSYYCTCKVSRKERAEINEAAKNAGLAVADLTRLCTLHIIREGTLEVHTQVRIATTKENNDDN